jgi:hypothetical protein
MWALTRAFVVSCDPVPVGLDQIRDREMVCPGNRRLAWTCYNAGRDLGCYSYSVRRTVKFGVLGRGSGAVPRHGSCIDPAGCHGV